MDNPETNKKHNMENKMSFTDPIKKRDEPR
jgi:hypothetical protein